MLRQGRQVGSFRSMTMDEYQATAEMKPEEYIALFRSYLEKNGYDYVLVRLYEAGLFLSMLPYHMDQPGKVFGFLLNAIRILDEVEKCTRI